MAGGGLRESDTGLTALPSPASGRGRNSEAVEGERGRANGCEAWTAQQDARSAAGEGGTNPFALSVAPQARSRRVVTSFVIHAAPALFPLASRECAAFTCLAKRQQPKRRQPRRRAHHASLRSECVRALRGSLNAHPCACNELARILRAIAARLSSCAHRGAGDR